jgi:hypothetical protein
VVIGAMSTMPQIPDGLLHAANRREGHIEIHGPHKNCEVSREYNIKSQSYRA